MLCSGATTAETYNGRIDMDELLNRAWELLYTLIQQIAAALDVLLSYLHFLGPVPVLVFLALVVVCLTKVLKRYIRTNRLITLETDFKHWLSIREEALKCNDSEKGRNLARNIDKAHLNRAYYDYFLEGLLLSLITFYLPVVCMATYINESYRAERLMDIFGRSYVIRFGETEPVMIGALFCFITAVLLINVVVFLVKLAVKRIRTRKVEDDSVSDQHTRYSQEQLFEPSSAS